MSGSEPTLASEKPSYIKSVNWIVHIIVTLLILVIAIGIVSMLFGSKPESKRWGSNREAPSVVVDIADIEVSDFQVWLDSYGTAQPLTQTALVSDVSGRVIKVSPNIRAGMSFEKGEVLVEIDDRDLMVEINVAKSNAAEAELRYLQEVAESELAAQDWNKRPLSDTARTLALREPQVAAAKAALDAAKARLSKAELDLQRTKIRAPFDGKVLSQAIDVGQVVTPSQSIANIYSTEAIEIRLPVKVGDLAYFNVDDNADNQVPARVSLIGELGNRTYEWTGTIVRSEGAFDPATRMLYLVAQVDQPFVNNDQRPAMRVGQFLQARIEGDLLKDVIVIPRRAVSQDYQVSVADEGMLRKRQITPLWTDANSVVISSSSGGQYDEQLKLETLNAGLQLTDKLILTPTANIPSGTRVKPITPQENGGQSRPRTDAIGASANGTSQGGSPSSSSNAG